MNLSLISIVFLIVAYLLCLAVWGYQDKKNIRDDKQVSAISVLCLSVIYGVIFLWSFSLNYYLFLEYIGLGFLVSVISFITLRNEMQPLDHYVFLIGNIAMPYLTLPAFLLTMAYTLWKGQTKTPRLWIFFCSFVVVLVAIGLYAYLTY